MMRKRLPLLLALAICLNFAACGADAPAETVHLPAAPVQTEPVPLSTTELVSTETAPTAPTESGLMDSPIGDQICIAIRPTSRSMEDRWFYAPCPDQTAARSAFDKAVSHLIDGKATNGEALTGLMVYGNNQYWDFTESGAMCTPWERIEAADAAELYALCLAFAQEFPYQEALRPKDIRNISSATMAFNDQTQTITDPTSLAKIGKWLSASAPCGPGGASCWFTALLTLETAEGHSYTIGIATDSCSTWITEGVCYEYPVENEDLFALFSMAAPDEA